MGTNNSHCNSLFTVLLAQFAMWSRHGQTGEQKLAEAGRDWAGTDKYLHFTAIIPSSTSFHVQSPLWMKIYLLPEAMDDF